MLHKLVVVIIGLNFVSSIDLDEYEPTDYDWDGMYDDGKWKLFSLANNIGLFVLSLMAVVGLVAGFLMVKKKV